MHRLLTVAIPTYNRRPCVTALATELAAAPVETLVVDDGSTDGTADALARLSNVRLLRNPSNLGFAPTLLRAFEEASTLYLLVMSDDDVLILENLEALQEFLGEHDPAFVSTQFFREGQLWRGRSACSALTPQDYKLASGHAPGLAFRADAVRPLVPLLRGRLDRGCVATSTYPQVITLAYLLAAAHLCMWWDRPIAAYGAKLPSGILDGSEPYTAVASRWRQEQGFIDFLREQVREAPPTQRARWQAMLTVHERLFFAVLRQSIRYERPDLASCFDAGAKVFYAGTFEEWTRRRRLRHVLRALTPLHRGYLAARRLAFRIGRRSPQRTR